MKQVTCDGFNVVYCRVATSNDHKESDDYKDLERKVENLDQAIAEIERLRKDGEKLQGELSGIND